MFIVRDLFHTFVTLSSTRKWTIWIKQQVDHEHHLKNLDTNDKRWDDMLKFIVWADRVAYKKAIGKILFQLVYGDEAKLSINIELLV